MIIAEMWSESMTWVSRGRTEDEAKANILKKWNERQKLYGLDYIYKTVAELEEHYDITIYDLTADTCIAY